MLMTMSKTDLARPDLCQELPDRLFRQLIEQSSDVTVLMSSTGQIVYVSPSIHLVFEFCPESAPLAEFLRWFHPDDRRCLEGVFSSVLPEPYECLSRLRHQRGYWIDCSVLIQFLTPSLLEDLGVNDGSHGYALSLRPLPPSISSQHRSVDQFARENEQTKSHFLAIMSHELRTPINAINGFSQLLLRQRRDRLSPEQADMVQRILRNGKNLLSLVNNVLDLSKLEAGRIQLNLEDVNVSDLIDCTIQELSSLATENNLSLTTDVDLSNPVITNDPLRLRQILVNLLSNAIKFSEGGQVWVVVKESSRERLKISVQDSGPGIASDDIPQVFSEFWQVDQLPSSKNQGTGLGLAISHNLAKMMEGEIQVHSQLGQGTTFRLVIPRKLMQGDKQA